MSDSMSYKFPVSVKGVVLVGGKVCLLRNERDEWELPGGKLEPDEEPAACVVREIGEELSLEVEAGELIDCWVYRIFPGVDVLIVTYGCRSLCDRAPIVSFEHKELGLFAPADVDALNMPEGYKKSIRCWLARLGE